MSDIGSVEQRRARLVARHRLDGSAASVLDAVRSVVVLHASDPASVYLSALARCRTATLADVAEALYEDRSLVRMMAMRRTLFVVPADLVPVVHHGASLEVAAWIRRRLVKELRTAPTDPPVPDDVEGWLAEVEAGVVGALERLGPCTGLDLSQAEPRLRTALLPTTTKTYDVRRTVTTQVLTLMGAEGRIVRTRPLGSWTSRRHTWEAATATWPDGIPQLPAEEARVRLVAAYLRRFGPASEADVAWWTGWPLGTTRRVIAAVGTLDVEAGLVLTDDADTTDAPEPTVALLPALDPTPMGWKERTWFQPAEASPLYDRNGNIGPTVWWAGEIVGGWATGKDGSVVTRLLVDRGAEAARAVDEAAQELRVRLEGASVVPSFRTPMERELSG